MRAPDKTSVIGCLPGRKYPHSRSFTRAFEKRRTYAFDRQDALPWLYGITTNIIGTHRRAEIRGYLALARTEEDPVAVAFDEREETAQALDVPVGTVRSRPSRARRKIAQALGGNPVGGLMNDLDLVRDLWPEVERSGRSPSRSSPDAGRDGSGAIGPPSPAYGAARGRRGRTRRHDHGGRDGGAEPRHGWPGQRVAGAPARLPVANAKTLARRATEAAAGQTEVYPRAGQWVYAKWDYHTGRTFAAPTTIRSIKNKLKWAFDLDASRFTLLCPCE
ncbi:hypothetical protein [Nonomuraea sp. NPDC050643]|uniref:RNA polymerase sigma factor n=1 Tax=Nonomuraea sp. NPDC050643 TaxID=3155660 RepID=UPI0033EDF640